jgi:hypothetical protein
MFAKGFASSDGETRARASVISISNEPVGTAVSLVKCRPIVPLRDEIRRTLWEGGIIFALIQTIT